MRLTDLDADWDRPFYRPLAFYLRFELGGERANIHEPVLRFVQAFDRARAVADAVFRSSAALLAIGASPEPWNETGYQDMQPPCLDGFAALQSLGFRIHTKLAQTWNARHPHSIDDDEIPEYFWQAFDITGERALRDTLIWNSIAAEMIIRPKAHVDSFLVDFERGLMLHIYDDRGMDVFATDPRTVLPVYQEFNSWLLDHDRPRIDAVMKPLTTA
jgi:hypothetical protein